MFLYSTLTSPLKYPFLLLHATWGPRVYSELYMLRLLGYMSIAIAVFALSYLAVRGNLDAAKLLVYVGIVLLFNNVLNNVSLSFSIVVEA